MQRSWGRSGALGNSEEAEWLQQREAAERVGDEADADVMGHCLDLAFTL